MTSPAAESLAELRVSLTPGVRVLDEGRVLVGGEPLRALSLTSRGADVVSGWRSPGAIGAGPARHDLARRLMDAGMLELHPPARVATDELTFVVPVRDRPEQLERCLRALTRAAPEARVIVVDDGSVTPVRDFGAKAVRVIRHPESRGAAAARNTGLAACSTTFVGFVDSDVVLPEAAPGRLLAHLVDPGVAAAAPRVRALGARGAIAAYEARHSALDMGPKGGFVAPGRPVSYVPSTVLFVRRSAIGRGFDEDLPIGEDVDFVWRLHASGGRVRYVHDVDVLHEHPARLAELVARRYVYACSVGMLARRHPRALPAVWITPAAALAWGLAIGGRRTWSAAVVIWSIARTEQRLRGVTPDVPAAGRDADAAWLRPHRHGAEPGRPACLVPAAADGRVPPVPRAGRARGGIRGPDPRGRARDGRRPLDRQRCPASRPRRGDRRGGDVGRVHPLPDAPSPPPVVRAAGG